MLPMFVAVVVTAGAVASMRATRDKKPRWTTFAATAVVGISYLSGILYLAWHRGFDNPLATQTETNVFAACLAAVVVQSALNQRRQARALQHCHGEGSSR